MANNCNYQTDMTDYTDQTQLLRSRTAPELELAYNRRTDTGMALAGACCMLVVLLIVALSLWGAS